MITIPVWLPFSIIFFILLILIYREVKRIKDSKPTKEQKKTIWDTVERKIRMENKKDINNFIILYIKYFKMVEHYDLHESLKKFIEFKGIKTYDTPSHVRDLLKCNKIKKLNRHDVPSINKRKVYYYQLVT